MGMTNEEKINLATEMYDQDCSMREIGNEVGMSYEWIKANIPEFEARKQKRKDAIQKRRQDVIDLWNQGMKSKDIAKVMGVSTGYVSDTIAKDRTRREKKEIEKQMQLNALKRAKKAPKLPDVEYKGKMYRDVFYQVAGW